MRLKTSFAATVVVLGCQLLFAPAVSAQSTDAAAKPGALSDAERAKRDADKVFQWIKFHAEHSPRPGSAQAAAPAPAAKPAARQAAAPRANAEVNQAAALSRESTVRETVVAQPAPAPSTEPVAQPQAQGLAAAPAAQTAGQAGQGATPNAGQMAAANEPAAAQLLAVAPAAVPQAPRVEPKVEPPKPEPQAEVPLQLLNKVEPEIPRQLVSTLRNGRVLVRFTVQPDGRVSKAEPIETSNKRLSQAAVSAVQQWRFAAIPTPREVTVEVGFRME